jgi:hypothetical protein
VQTVRRAARAFFLEINAMKFINRVRKYGPRLAAAGGALVLAPLSFAASPYQPIIDAVDFGDVGTAVYGVAGALAAILVIIMGVRFALKLLRS